MGNITKILGVAEKAAMEVANKYPGLIKVGGTTGTFIGAANLLMNASNWLKANNHRHTVEEEKEKPR